MKRILLALAAMTVLTGPVPLRAEQADRSAALPDPATVEIIAVEPRSTQAKPIIASVDATKVGPPGARPGAGDRSDQTGRRPVPVRARSTGKVDP